MTQDDTSHQEISLHEQRRFAPPVDFAKRARIHSQQTYQSLCDQAENDPEGYWREQAKLLDWAQPFNRVMQWQAPHCQWFLDGKLNVSYNCLDRHLLHHGDKAALLFEGEPGDRRCLTYRQLHEEVCQLANGLLALGVQPKDRVAIYMPLIPEAIVAMLACARIGAMHSVVFGGFASDALRDRINDAGASLVLTADGSYRRGQIIPLKEYVDEALTQTPSVKHVMVIKRTQQPISMKPERDIDYHSFIARQPTYCEPTAFDSEHPLFVLYTSGTTGKPKGVVHASAGYLLNAALTTSWIFDVRDEDIYWCTADIGWITGHTYVVYGPLALASTIVLYEGAPNHPQPDRFWEIIDRYRVSIFYTAPTAIRSFIKWGDEFVNRHQLDSLRLLGSVGEPINPEAWMWYHRLIGKNRCPIVDTWWQTETGAIMASPLPGITTTKPGSCTRPLPGMAMDVVDKQGISLGANEKGYLVIKKPWPSMLRSIFNDPERLQKNYFSEIPGVYFSGDSAKKDHDGYFWILGRMDDVLKVAGHRLGTMEVESSIVSCEGVAEAAVVGRPDDIKGQALVAFVTLKSGIVPSHELANKIKSHVAYHLGGVARPDVIRFADVLPKTRSGKIMRRLLRELAVGNSISGDVSTLEDLSSLEKLRGSEEE